jgi:hypothetical protein
MKMIDTIRLLIPIEQPQQFDGSYFTPTIREVMNGRSYAKATLTPSKTYAKMGKYMPQLTFFKRPTNPGIMYELAIEFSAPKMLFSNNFDELQETDLAELLKSLQAALFDLTKCHFSDEQLLNAAISKWHPSKNIIFEDYTAAQTVINVIAKLDVSRIYDRQYTTFRDGHVIHFHCNSVDIAFYDKMADLRKAQTSDKRTFARENIIQLDLLEQLTNLRPFEVVRYEVRLANRKAVRKAYPQIPNPTLQQLFKAEHCRSLLLAHWQKLSKTIDMIELDEQRPYELLQNYLAANPGTKPMTALAAVSGLLICGQVGVSGLRNVLDAQYDSSAWYRLKPIIKAPGAHRYKHFTHLEEALKSFEPVHVKDYLKPIDY